MNPRPARPLRPLSISLARLSSSLAIAATMALAGSARATVLDWDPAGNQSNSGGPGTWDLTSSIWHNGVALADQLWVNANLDTARFGGTGGTVTLGTGITAGGLNFNVDGMTVTGNTLTLGGATPAINVLGGATATISSTLAGTAGAVVTGGGTLVLTQANTISGPWDITATSTVQANNLGALGAGAVSVEAGSTLAFNAGGGNLNNAIILNGGTLTQTAAAQLTTQGLITVNAASIINIAQANPGKIFVNAGIAGTGNLTQNGGGILQIVQANLGYSGNWTLNGGFTEVQNSTALGTGTVTVNSGSELVASNLAFSNPVIIGSAGATLSFDNGNAGNFAGPVNAAQDFNVGLKNFYGNNPGDAHSGTISGVISGSGAMTIVNPPAAVSLTLTGNNAAWSGAVNVPTNVQLRAVVGGSGNALGTGVKTINGSLVLITTPTLAAGVNAGFSGRYYNSPLIGGNQQLGSGVIGGFDFGLVNPVGTRNDPLIDFAYDNSRPNFSPIPAVAGLNTEHVGVLWTGVLSIGSGGNYTFTTGSDDGSLLYVDGVQIVQNDFGQGTTERSGAIILTTGLHSIIVKFSNGVGPGGVIADYAGPDTPGGARARIGSVANTLTNTGSQILGTSTIATPITLGANGTGGFDLAAVNTTVTGALTLGTNLGMTITGVTGSEVLTLAGPVTLNGAHTFTIGIDQVVNGAQNASAGADVVISGNIGETVVGSSITKTGPRTLTLSGTNSFTGPTTVINGVLQLNSPVPNSAVGPGGLVINPTAGSVVVRLLTNEQMPDAAVLAISSVGENTALFDLNGFTETIGGLTVTATAGSVTGVTTGAAGTLIANGDITFNNNRAAITNTGREALITGTGTYSVAASNGTLNLGGALRNITVATTNTGLNLPGSDATIETAIVNGGINKLGTQTLILTGASTYAGGTVISAGTVRAVGASGAASSVLGTGLVTLKGGSLQLRNNGTGSNGTITYGNNLLIDASQASGLIDLNNNGANTGNTIALGNLAIGAQTLNVSGGNGYGLRFSSATLSGNATVNLTTAGASLTLNNVGETGGAQSLTKSATSPGVLILTGNGTYTGGTVVPLGSGPLRLVPTIGTTFKPAGTGAISLANGTTMQIAPVITSLSNAGAVQGSLSAKYYNGLTTIATGNYAAIPTAATTVALLADGTFFNRPAVLTPASATNLLAVYSGLLNITAGGAYSFQTAVQSASQLVIDGVPVISVNTAGLAPQSLTDSATSAPITLSAGFHTIVMKAFNGTAGGGFRVRYQGGDTGGNLQVIAPSRLYTVPTLTNVGNTGAPVSLAAGVSISLDGVGSDLDSSITVLTLGAGSTLNAVNAGGSGVISVTGTTTLQGAAALSPTSALLNLVGDLADGGGNFPVTKTGAGTLVLTGAKTFGGTLTISGGGVQVTNAASLGAVGGGTIVNAGGTLDLNGVALGAEPLTLNGVGTGITTAAALYNSSAAAASASGPVNIATAAAIGGFGDLTLSGALSGAASLTKIGADTLTLSGGNVGFTGALVVSQGIVKLGSATALGTVAGNTTVNAGAVLDLNGQTTSEPLSISGAGLVNFGAQNTLGALINTSATPATVSGGVTLGALAAIGSSSLTGGGNITISGVISGTPFNKVGGNTLTLTAVNTYTGAATVQLGTLLLSGAGTVVGESQMSVSPAATLTLDDTGTNNTASSRLGSKPLFLIGGNFNILGNATANTLEDIGTGQLKIDTHNAVVTLTPGGGKNVQFKAASLLRTGNFTTKGTALFRGAGLGTATAASLTAGTANITFTTVPTGAAAFGQTGAAGSPNRAILPWALVDTATGGPGSSFATYSTGNGLQVLQVGDFTATLIAINNVVATAALTAPAGGLTINSLTLKTGGGLTIGAGNNIALDSGGLLATATAGISGAGLLTTTSDREIIIHTAGSGTILTIGTPIATAGGLTKAGDGTLTLTAHNTFTGQTRLNGGTTKLAGGVNTIFFPLSTPPVAGATATVPRGNSLFVDAGATLDLNGNDQRIGGLSSIATVASGTALPGTSGTITNTSGITANFRFTRSTNNIVPTILAGNLNIQRDGTGVIVFTSPSTYTGSTTLTGGTLTLQDGGGLLNTSSLAIRRAALKLDDTQLQTATRVNASATVGLDGGAITFLSRSGGTADALNLGAMTLNTGASIITQTLGGTSPATSTGTSTVNIASLARSQGATITFAATAAGTNVQLGDNPRVFLGTGTPALTGGLVGGWATTLGYNSASPLSLNGSFDFASYDPVTGFRPTSYTAAFGVGNNVNVEPDSAGASVTTLAAGDTAANSLRIGGTGTTTSTTLAYSSASDLLNLQTGGLLSTNSNSPRFIGALPDAGRLTAGGTAASGTSELFIHNGAPTQPGPTASLTINAQIVNNPNGAQVAVVLGGLSQSSTIQLNGTNTYTGTTYVNGVNVNLNSPGLAIPGNLIISGGTAGGDSQTSGNQTVTLLAGNQIAPTANVTVNGGGGLNLGAFNNTINNLTLASDGGGAGSIGPVVQTGTGVITLNGGITTTNLQATAIPVLSGNVTLPVGVHTVAIGAVAGAPGQIGLQINALLTGGSLNVTSGVLGLGHDANKVSTAALNLSAGTSLTLTNLVTATTITPTIGALTGSGSVNVNLTGTAQVNLVIGNDNGTGTFTGSITGPISISKVGTGTQTFTQSMTLNSLTIADGGEVVFGDGLGFAALAPNPGFAPALVPEPGTAGLLLIGALGVLARRRR